MAKKLIEVFDIDTEVVFLLHNKLCKGKIIDFRFYSSNILKYDIEFEGVIKKDIFSIDIFESKEAYINYINKLEI
jgi:hypothetical protein